MGSIFHSSCREWLYAISKAVVALAVAVGSIVFFWVLESSNMGVWGNFACFGIILLGVFFLAKGIARALGRKVDLWSVGGEIFSAVALAGFIWVLQKAPHNYCGAAGIFFCFIICAVVCYLKSDAGKNLCS